MESPSQAYPTPVVGQDKVQPGFWAHTALKNPWPRGKRVRTRPETLLHELQTASLRREPGVRTLKNGEDFYYTIGTKTANIEALLVQSIGERIDIEEACDSCQRHQGPFTSCVIAPDLRHLLTTCANCHWGSKGQRCSFTSQPPVAHTTIDKPETLEELEETLAKEILARDSAIAAFHEHNRRIKELLSTKATILAEKQQEITPKLPS